MFAAVSLVVVDCCYAFIVIFWIIGFDDFGLGGLLNIDFLYVVLFCFDFVCDFCADVFYFDVLFFDCFDWCVLVVGCGVLFIDV